MNAVELTQKLVRFDTTNPGNNEGECIHFLDSFLKDAGFETTLAEWKPGRPNLIAKSRGGNSGPALCFTGHVDTVPLGTVPWTHPPFGGDIVNGKLYGRGATDMKSGVAAMIIAAVEAAKLKNRSAEVLLVVTVGEETGCEGSLHLSRTPGTLGGVGAMIVTEPTDNELKLGHRGALWLKASRRGVAAPGSRPDLGENAVYGLAEGVLALRDLVFPVNADPILGMPSLNVGTFHGGSKINMVPDLAEVEIDIRTLPGQKSGEIIALIQEHLGEKVEIEALMDLAGIIAETDNPWVRTTAELLETSIDEPGLDLGLPYFTDAATLTPAVGNVPTLFLGPGDTTMLHKVDEFVSVSALESCTERLTAIAKNWCI